MPTDQWGARSWPPPRPSFAGFLNEVGCEGPAPNPILAAALMDLWLELDRDLADVLFDPNIDHRTISYHAATGAALGLRWAVKLCAILDVIDPGHCARAKGEPPWTPPPFSASDSSSSRSASSS